MKKQNEVRYIVTSVVSIPVIKIASKTEAYKQAAKPGWGTVEWYSAADGYKNPVYRDRKDKTQQLVCDEDCSADLYTKNGGYFGIYPYEEINVAEMPKQAACAAIVTSDSCGYSFWTEDSKIRIFVTYDENGLIDNYRLEYGDSPIYDDETELAFEDLFVQPEGDWRETYRAELPGTIEHQFKQEAAALVEEAGETWMDDKQREDFRQICNRIDSIKNAENFPWVMQKIAYDFEDVRVINAARKFKKSPFDPQTAEEPEAAADTTTQDEAGTAAEAASKGRETALGTPDKMAGTDTTATTDGQQAAPQGPQGATDGPAAVERDNGRQPGGP